MNTKLGATVHEEGGFQIVEVLERVPGKETVIGYTIVGPGVDPLFISPDVATALNDLRRLGVGLTPWPSTRGDRRQRSRSP